MSNLLSDLQAYFKNTPSAKIHEDWAKYAEYDKVGPKVSELLTHFETHFHYKEDPEIEQALEIAKNKITKPDQIGLLFFILVP
jgi:hypothetical protein